MSIKHLFLFLLAINIVVTSIHIVVGQSSSNVIRTTDINDDLPEDFPEFVVNTQNNATPGTIFLSPTVLSPYKLIQLDETGNVLNYIEREAVARYANFQWKAPDQLLYHYTPPDTDAVFYVTDLQYQITDSIRAGDGEIVDFHEIVFKENGNAIILTYDIQTVDMSVLWPGGYANATVAGLIIQEVDYNQNVIWDWHSWDHFEITDGISSGINNLIDFTGSSISYLHANALELDENENLLLSCRNSHEITKIEYPSGNVLWRMGGKNNEFTFIDDPLDGFTSQHDPQYVSNNRITIFDNGNFHETPTSRVVEYEIDEMNKTATLVWSYENPYGVLSKASGNAQRLSNGNTFINWGIIDPFDAPIVMEVDPNGNVVFELSVEQFGEPTGQFTYRAWKYEDYMPTSVVLSEAPLVGNIYPNPVTDHQFIIQGDFDSNQIDLRIFQLNGVQIPSNEISINTHENGLQIELTKSINGLYYFQLYDQVNNYTGKFIIQ